MLRPLRDDAADAAFLLRLMNEPAWLEHIGDRGIRTLADARRHVVEGPRASYAKHGHGLMLVARRADGEPVGICGLVRRATLPDADLGFAILAAHHRRGYARESARAVIEDARSRLGRRRLLAVTSPANHASRRLLGSLGFREAAVGSEVAEGVDPARTIVHELAFSDPHDT